jgi:hypothetical protein
VSWPHQIALVMLTAITFLLESVPLEIQRRVVNDLRQGKIFSTGPDLVRCLCRRRSRSGLTKLVVNVYRCWVGENAIWDLRRHILAYLRVARVAAPARRSAVSGSRCSSGKSNRSVAL